MRARPVFPVSFRNPILHLIPKLLEKYDRLSILVISMHNQPSLIKPVMDAGASGYILKEDQATIRELGNVISTVAEDSVSVLYSSGVNPNHSPSEADISLLLAYAENHHATTSPKEHKVFGWARLIFPVRVEGKVIGLWLLANRNPDDVYAESEISVLETIADHTAIALVNIAQAERLLMLYKSNITGGECNGAFFRIVRR